jgi:hypothetical protein
MGLMTWEDVRATGFVALEGFWRRIRSFGGGIRRGMREKGRLIGGEIGVEDDSSSLKGALLALRMTKREGRLWPGWEGRMVGRVIPRPSSLVPNRSPTGSE